MKSMKKKIWGTSARAETVGKSVKRKGKKRTDEREDKWYVYEVSGRFSMLGEVPSLCLSSVALGFPCRPVHPPPSYRSITPCARGAKIRRIMK